MKEFRKRFTKEYLAGIKELLDSIETDLADEIDRLASILKKARESKVLDVVDDQIGSPTYAGDLADAIIRMVPRLIGNMGQGLYHYANQGVCSWYDFAGAIVEIAGLDTEVRPVASSDYITPAPRPGYSVLDTSRIRKETGISIPFWKDSLVKYIKNLK